MSNLLPLATVSQLETRLGLPIGTLADTDLARAQAALADASELVRAEGRIAWVDGLGIPTPPPAVVVVVLQIAMRAYNNPNGYAGETVSANGATYSYSADQQSLGIYLTDDELRTVMAAAHLATYGTGPRAWHGTGSVMTPKPDVRGPAWSNMPYWTWRP